MTSPEPAAHSDRHRAAEPHAVPADASIQQVPGRMWADEPTLPGASRREPERPPERSSLSSTLLLVVLGLIGLTLLALIVLAEAAR
jgi:hypothetical protein